MAELLRRVADLAVTFGIPSKPVHLPYPASNAEPFIFFIQQPLLDDLTTEAARRDTDTDTLFSEALHVYLRRREIADIANAA